ncbi:MAG TPA: class I SAM-dependent methyltransferase [Opitutaceae bacterium]|nr:class I SAM-dependent methyltransferase [Opitutaceae bacterium]
MTAPALACRVCGSRQIELLGRKPGEFIRRDFEFHRCRDCGLIFVEPFSGSEIYNDAYYRGAGPDPFVDYETEYRDWRRSDRGMEFDDMARIAEKRLRDQEPKGTKDLAPIQWLDFGCGAGGFLKYLRERRTLAGRALELTGHDLGSYADQLARVDGFRILDLEQVAREPSGRYEVISMIEVIEHVPDPAVVMELVARLLKPGGLLLLTTGNMENPTARRHGIHYRYCAPEIHVTLFNPACLARLYRRVGLEPFAVRYRGAVKFKVVKSLRYRPALRSLSRLLLAFPPAVRVVDWLYGVSDMPCAVKRS